MARHTERPATPADDDLLGELAADHLTRISSRGQRPRKTETAPAETPPARKPAKVPEPSEQADTAEADQAKTDAQPQTTPEDEGYIEETHQPPAEDAPQSEPAVAVDEPQTPTDTIEDQQQALTDAPEEAAETDQVTIEVSQAESTTDAPEAAASVAPSDTDYWPEALDENNIPDALQEEQPPASESPAPPPTPMASTGETAATIEPPAEPAAQPLDEAPPEEPGEMVTRLRDADKEPEELDVPPTASGMEGIESRIMDSPTMASGVGYLTEETEEPPTPPPPPKPAPKDIGAEQIAPEEVNRAGGSKARHVDSGAFSVRIVGDGPSLDGEDEDEHDINLGAEPTNVILPEGSSDLYTVRIGPEEESPEWPDMSSSPLNQLAMEDSAEQAPPQEDEDNEGSVAQRIAELISNIARQKSGKSEEEQAENLASEALAEESQTTGESSVAEELAREMADETQQESQAAAETPPTPPPPPPISQVEDEEDDEDDDEIVLEGMPAPPPPDEEDDGSPKGQRRDARTSSMNGDVVNMADLGDRKARRVKARPRKGSRRQENTDRNGTSSVAEDVLDDQLAREDAPSKHVSRRDRRKAARSSQSAPNRSLAKRAVMISPQPQKKESRLRNLGIQGAIVLGGLLITALLLVYLLVFL